MCGTDESGVELTLGPPHPGILLRQASLLVAKWLPPALSLSPTRGSRSLPHGSSKDMGWSLWGSALADRFILEQITVAKEGHRCVTYPGALSPAGHRALLSEDGEWRLSGQARRVSHEG